MERYGVCKTCQGKGCGICGNTGFSGDAMDLLDSRYSLRIARRSDATQVKRSRHELLQLAILSIESSTNKIGRK